MPLSIGLDIGGSTTKVMALKDGAVHGRWLGRADDAEASAYGALFKFLSDEALQLTDVKHLAVTGVGRHVLNDGLIPVPILRVDEFDAVGAGGLFLTGLDEAVVVSMGTGTAFVHAREGQHARHIIGSGVGGGTLMGLSRALMGTRDFSTIDRLAEAGDHHAVDLAIADISTQTIEGLSGEVTASNFGKLRDDTSREDLAAGMVTMIYQTVGILATLCARQCGTKDVIWVGQASELATGQAVLRDVADLYGMHFHMPSWASHATACGAALIARRHAE